MLLFTLALAVLSQGFDPAADPLAHLTAPAKALRFEATSSRSTLGSARVHDLLSDYAALLGWKLEYASEEDENSARALHTGLLGDLTVPAERVHFVVQSILCANHFVLRFESRAGTQVLLVACEGMHESGGFVTVPEGTLGLWSDQPAFLVSVDLPTPGVEAELLRDELHAFTVAGRGCRIDARPDGGLRIAGTAGRVRFLVDMLRDAPVLAQPLASQGHAQAATSAGFVAAFPLLDSSLNLMTDYAPPTAPEVLQAFSQWSQRPLLEDLTLRTKLGKHLPAAGLPGSVAPDRVYSCISDLLAEAGCELTPYPATRPVAWLVETPSQWLDPLGVTTIRLDELDSVRALRTTRFQTFVRLPRDERPGRAGFERLASEDENAPFWITPLTEPELLSVIGTPHAIELALGQLRRVCGLPAPR